MTTMTLEKAKEILLTKPVTSEEMKIYKKAYILVMSKIWGQPG